MTIEQFKQTGFSAGMKALYNGRVYDVASIDFAEYLIGILEHIPGGDPDDVSWKRCENIEIIKD